MKENLNLKIGFVLQSFAPLFLILCVKHVHCYWKYINPMVSRLKDKDWSIFFDILNHKYFGDLIVFIISVLWIFLSVLIYFGFTGMFRTGFETRGEKITISADKRESGATFLASFVLPLLVDDVSTVRGFVVFVLLLGMMIMLLMNSNLFYQNPVLTILGYKTFEFQFKNQDDGSVKNDGIVKQDKSYIGLTKKKIPEEGTAIKRKYISDDVFIIFNN